MERQARRLQQSSGRTTANTGTLMEAIRQTIIELRALNSIKEAPQLIGAETLRILLANQVDVMKILKDFRPEMSNRKYHQQLTSQLGFGKSNKNNSFNPFSIENLLAGSKHGVVNSLTSGQVNSMFNNVSALAGLGVGALSNLGVNNGQFSEAFNGMQAINNGAFASAAAAALANAQLNSGKHFANHHYDMSDLDDDSSSADSYMSDEMLDVMMDDDLSTMKSNEKLALLNEDNNQIKNGSLDCLLEKERSSIEDELKLKMIKYKNESLASNLAINLTSNKEQIKENNNCSIESSDNSLNSDDEISTDNKFKKRKKKEDSKGIKKKASAEGENEECNNKEVKECLDEPNENSSKETNQVQLNQSTKKRILSELNDAEKLIKTAIKEETIDNNQLINTNNSIDEQTEQLDKHNNNTESSSATN